jgi:hypothetical protein
MFYSEPLDKYFTQITDGGFKEIIVSLQEYKGSKRTTMRCSISSKDIEAKTVPVH